MKKSLCLILAVMLLICCMPLSGCGNQGYNLISVKNLKASENEMLQKLVKELSYLDECSDEDFVCVLNEGLGDQTVLPSDADGHPVVYVTAEDNFPNTKATAIKFPDSAKFIDMVYGSSSFSDVSLTSVTVPEGCVIVNSFKSCEKLDGLKLNNLSNIDSSFINCDELKTADLSGTSRLSGSFRECKSLASVKIDSVETVEESFVDCDSLSDVDVSDITDISESFNECDSLKSVAPTGCTDGVYGSFNNCALLEDIDLTGVTRLSESFVNCPSVKTADLIDVESTFYCFDDCESLETASIPKVTELQGAFKNCASLKSITGGAELDYIHDAICECPNLASIPALPKLTMIYTSFDKCDSIISTEFARKANSVTYSFRECAKLTGVVFDGICEVEEAFSNCDALKAVTCTYAAPLESDYSSTDDDDDSYDDDDDDYSYSDDDDDYTYGEDDDDIEGLKVKSAFEDDKALSAVTLNGTVGVIRDSFNRLPEFTTFNYKSLAKYSSSFEECPKLKTEILDDEERAEREEQKRKEEEERKKKEELDNEPYGPGQSGIELSASSEKEAFFRLLKMNGDTEFSVHLDCDESTTKYFPSGRYVLEVIKGTDWQGEDKGFKKTSSHMYSEIFTFEAGGLYEISTGDRSDFRSTNPLNSM